MNCEKLLKQAGYTCLLQKSIDRLTVQEILKEADVSKQTFYRYYSDKYELGNAIYHDLFVTDIYDRDDVQTSCDWDALYLARFGVFRKHLDFLRHVYDSRAMECAVDYEIRQTLAFDRRFLAGKGVDVEDPLIRFALEAKDVSGTFALKKWVLKGMPVSDRDMVRWFHAVIPAILVPWYSEAENRDSASGNRK